MLSDTVGFVRDLPHDLVASFKATLEEAIHADLLLHVLDVGHPHARVQFDAVHKVLDEIGASGKPEVLLLNKVDTDAGRDQADLWRMRHAGSIAISAKTGAGLGDLHAAVMKAVRGTQVDVRLACPVTDGKLIHFVRRNLLVRDEQVDDAAIHFDVTVGRQLLKQLRENPSIEIEPVEDGQYVGPASVAGPKRSASGKAVDNAAESEAVARLHAFIDS